MKSFVARAAAVLAALSLALVPAAAAPVTRASPAQQLSVTRAATPVRHASDLRGLPIVGLLAVVAVIAGVVILTRHDHKPHSP